MSLIRVPLVTETTGVEDRLGTASHAHTAATDYAESRADARSGAFWNTDRTISNPLPGTVTSTRTRRLNAPLHFTSQFQKRVWGGQAFARQFQHGLSPVEPYGEIWDISTLPGFVSRVADGPFAGCQLNELWKSHRLDLVGGASSGRQDEFPLLIKWLECRDWLSVQVHPDDQMAQNVLNQPLGKSEVWVILHAEPESRIMAGFRPGVTREMVLDQLNAGTLENCLNSFKPRAGDCVVLPAGTVHAAGNGLLIAEVQQSSDVTFRLFDWNRAGLDGRPRPLQIDLALQAIDWSQGPVSPAVPLPLTRLPHGVHGELLAELPQFHLERFRLTASWSPPRQDEMTTWMVLNGAVRLTHAATGEVRDMVHGRTVLIPAAAGAIHWTPLAPATAAELLCIRIPN